AWNRQLHKAIVRHTRELRASEEKARVLLNATTDAAVLLTPDGTVVAANNGAAEQLGLTPEELVGECIFDVELPEVVGRRRKAFREFQANKEPARFEDEKRGRYYDNSIFPILDSNGKLQLVAVFSRDITERRQAEESLRINERRWKQAQAVAKIGNWEYDPATGTFWGSEEALRIYGLDPDVAVTPGQIPRGERVFACIPEREKVHRALVDLILESKPYILEHDVIREIDGERIIVQAIAQRIAGDEGTPAKASGTIRDITAQRQLEMELKRQAAAIEQVDESIVITDAEAEIVYINPAFERITGYSREETIGQNPRILQSGTHSPSFYQAMWDRLTRGESWKGRLVNKRKDGTVFHEEASISPVLDSDGNVSHYIGVKRDMTSEIAHERHLRGLQKMEAVGTLASGIAHDFNNILSAIVGFSELALSDMAPESRQHPYIENVLAAGKRAAQLVRQILTVSRQSEHERAPVNLAPIVQEAMQLIRASIPSVIAIEENIETD
ncbi:MAG: PAS domain S-box protein, partial [Spirochaetaceae bacterium]|nr:PAS domain S-box protein [Spirochaetaceae bacterium]